MDIRIKRIDSVTIDVSDIDNKYRIVQSGKEQRVYSVYLDTNKVCKFKKLLIGSVDATNVAIFYTVQQILKTKG